jgi:hypothetical protein
VTEKMTDSSIAFVLLLPGSLDACTNSELIGVCFLCCSQLKGCPVVVHVAVAILVASVRAVLKTSGCEFEKTSA